MNDTPPHSPESTQDNFSTDPEVLEFRFPVQLESYEIRQNSGGAGRWVRLGPSVRKSGPVNGKHFHVLLLLNKDVYYSLELIGDSMMNQGTCQP